MPGTRTAGDPTSVSPTSVRVSYRFIDESGDLRSVSYDTTNSVTDQQIEDVAAALQPASNASLYDIVVSRSYAGDRLASNASSNAYPSVYDNIALGLKNLTFNAQQTAYIPAPVKTLVPTGDTVDTAASLYTAWRTAVLALLQGSYTVRQARLTERVERNEGVPG